MNKVTEWAPEIFADESQHLDSVDLEEFYSPGSLETGEHRLYFAILEQALMELVRYGSTTDPISQRRFHRVHQWVLANETEWPTSFINICQALDIDETRLRNAVEKWRGNHAPHTYTPPPKRRRKKRIPCSI